MLVKYCDSALRPGVSLSLRSNSAGVTGLSRFKAADVAADSACQLGHTRRSCTSQKSTHSRVGQTVYHFRADRHDTDGLLKQKFTEVQLHMARISGVDLPREKRVEIGLTYIYGIGRVTAGRILEQANVNPDTRVRDLTDEEVARIRDVIDETVMVEGDLRREIAMNIKRLQEIGCYRGIRHRKGLPVRGQKTKTNARTRKGPKRTVANKKK